MGNIISSFLSGFTQAIGKLFGSPLDFLAGKSCSSVCGSTWDFSCYIENFCVANLLKMAMVLLLSYIVVLFFYLIYKVGICHCTGHCLWKITWTIIASWFSLWEFCFTFLCVKFCKLKRVNMEGLVNTSEEYDSRHRKASSSRSLSRRWRRVRLRKSLRPRNDRIQVGVSSSKHGHQVSTIHDIRVTRTSKFAQKSSNYRRTAYRRRR